MVIRMKSYNKRIGGAVSHKESFQQDFEGSHKILRIHESIRAIACMLSPDGEHKFNACYFVFFVYFVCDKK